MVGRAFSVKVNFDLHAVTCPGVWLCPNGKVTLKIRVFKSCIATQKITPVFPLLYHNKYVFQKVFTGVTTLADLEKKLQEENIFAELLQWSPTINKSISLAIFESNLVDLLYPVPCFKGLLPGIDVDLLMKSSKLFPGILSPKIEVSTKTTIEEVTDLNSHLTEACIINSKMINSMNQHCMHNKEEPAIDKKILRQKKVCHLNRQKHKKFTCKHCPRISNNVEVIHRCNEKLNHTTLPSGYQCYLSTSKKREICSCRTTVSYNSEESNNAYHHTHVLDSCPICLKYNCYFSNEKSDSTNVLKIYDAEKSKNMAKKYLNNKTKFCNSVDENDNNYCYCRNPHYKQYSLGQYKSNSVCELNCATSLKASPTTSILLSKMKQLETTKEKLNYANCEDRHSEKNTECVDIRYNKQSIGFYENLGKFYKKMYKQAKKHAHDLGGT